MLNFNNLVPFFFEVDVNWSMWDVSKPWHVVMYLHPVNWQLVNQALFVQFSRYYVGSKLGEVTGSTVLLNDFNDALVNFVVLNDFTFKSI